jgi:hypothetical protein
MRVSSWLRQAKYSWVDLSLERQAIPMAPCVHVHGIVDVGVLKCSKAQVCKSANTRQSISTRIYNCQPTKKHVGIVKMY